MELNYSVRSTIVASIGFGVKIEKTIINNDKYLMEISVPERSWRVDNNGNELSGENLARRFWFKMIRLKKNSNNFEVNFKIREGEFWTREMENIATKEAMDEYLPIPF